MANLHDNLKTNMAAIVNEAYWKLAYLNEIGATAMTNHRESFMSFGKKVSHLERGPELNLGPRKIYLFDNQGETRYISSKEAKDTPPASLTEKLGSCEGIGEPRVCLKAKLLITNITNINDIGYMKCSHV